MSEYAPFLKILLAAACGALVGLPANVRRRPGGIRAHALAAMGGAMFCLSAFEVVKETGDSVRVIQGIASGVGFIGAATVLRREGSVQGITTAASIWIVAAIGCFAAIGDWKIAVFSAVLATALDVAVIRAERRLLRRKQPKGARFDHTQ